MPSALNKKCIQMILFFLLIYLFSITPAVAIGEASTSFYVYVPPNNYGGGDIAPDGIPNYGYASYLIVTATQNSTKVNIIDLDGIIGEPTNQSSFLPQIDNDYNLTETGIALYKGQSRVIKVSLNTSGPDSDGTYFHINSNKPVLVYNVAGSGRYMNAMVPSSDGSMLGKNFFVYMPDTVGLFNDPNPFKYDLIVFAYENDTNVKVIDITYGQPTLVEMWDSTQLNATTSVNLSSSNIIHEENLTNSNPVLYLQAMNNSGLERGRTYWIIANKNVTVGSLGIFNGNPNGPRRARDAGEYIPGNSNNPYRAGTGLASSFYYQLNGPDWGDENELYLINQNTSAKAYVTIKIWNESTKNWDNITGQDKKEDTPNGLFVVNSSGIRAVLGKANVKSSGIPELDWDNIRRYDNYIGLLNITSKDQSGNPMDISIFSANWLETGASNTSDISTFVSGETGYGGSKEHITYVPPPGDESFIFGEGAEYSHLYVYIHNNNTNLTFQAWNKTINNWSTVSEGIYNNLSKNSLVDYRVDMSKWSNGMDSDGSSNWNFHIMRIISTDRVTVQISNWNDNWASYVPGGTPPQFSARMSVQSRYLTVNSIPAPKIKYSFDIVNGAIGNIGSDLFDLSVTNRIPDGIDQTNIFWSITSNMGGFEYNSLLYPGDLNQSTLSNGTRYVWKNDSMGLKVTGYAYNNGSGTVFVFNKSRIGINEILSFNVNTPLNATYYDGAPIQSGIIVINVSAQAENPFLGKLTTFAKLPGTIILHFISPGTIVLY